MNRLERNGGKNIKVPVSKTVHRRSSTIRAVYKDHKILITLKGCITLSFKFLELQHKFLLFYDCRTYKNIFRLYQDRASKTKVVNLKVNCKELRLVFVHLVNTQCT